MLLIILGTVWIAGIFAGSFLGLPWLCLLFGLLPLPLLFVLKKQRRTLVRLSLAITVFLAGMAFFPSVQTVPPFSATDLPLEVELEGRVSAPPEYNNNLTHLELAVDRLNGQTVATRILLFVPRYPQFEYGERLMVSGTLSEAPVFDDFDYQSYLARDKIYAVMLYPQVETVVPAESFSPLGWIFNLRQKLAESLERALPEPQSSLAQGIVLGIRTGIPADLKQAMAITGATHLIAISGVNLTIIAGIITTLGVRLFGRRYYLYIWLALAVVWFYSIISGLEPPVIRSAIMASVFLLAELAGRQKLALPALLLSAAVMVGLDTQLLWSVSFQLSFLAMLGLIVFSPLICNPLNQLIIERWGEESLAVKLLSPVIASFGISLAATLLVWPVISYNFGVFSLIGLVTTFLIGPVLAPIIILGSFTALAGLLSPFLAQLPGYVAWVFISYKLLVVKALSLLPCAAISTTGLSVRWIALYYALVLLFILVRPGFRSMLAYLQSGFQKLTILYARIPRQYVLIPLLIIALLTSLGAASLPDNRLRVSFLNVGQGDATLIRAGGQNILVDGGPDPQAVCLEISRQLPFWDRSFDLLVLTHPHSDHLSGLLEVLKRYKVSSVLALSVEYSDPLYLEWLNQLSSKNITVVQAERGQTVDLANGASLTLLNPALENCPVTEKDFDENSIVISLNYGSHTFLLPADINTETEQELLKRSSLLSCTVLKTAHHGSGASTGPEFLEQAGPQLAVISCGENNRYGHPAEELLQRLDAQRVFRTDRDGTVTFISDGTDLRVKTDR